MPGCRVSRWNYTLGTLTCDASAPGGAGTVDISSYAAIGSLSIWQQQLLLATPLELRIDYALSPSHCLGYISTRYQQACDSLWRRHDRPISVRGHRSKAVCTTATHRPFRIYDQTHVQYRPGSWRTA